jgi:hypothetical protein
MLGRGEPRELTGRISNLRGILDVGPEEIVRDTSLAQLLVVDIG